MAGLEIDVLVIDTSVLRGAGLKNPDFQKILQRSREKKLRVAVPHIAWEEWRTQQVTATHKKIKEVRETLEDLERRQGILARFPKIEIALPSDEDLELRSKEMMDEISTQNSIEVLKLGVDHAERAWRRYFALRLDPPFNPAVEREERRKDIPDSWILEACIDLLAQTKKVAALCNDGRLHAALEKAGIRVFRRAQDLVAELEAAEAKAAEETQSTEAGTPEYLETKLNEALAQARDYDRRVLGLVAHFDTVGKDELTATITRLGIPPDAVENSARRLVAAGLLKDTGNHYLVPDRRTSEAAAQSVEADVIALL